MARRTRAHEMPIVASVGPYALSTGTASPHVSAMSSAIFSPPTISTRRAGRSAGSGRRPRV